MLEAKNRKHSGEMAEVKQIPREQSQARERKSGASKQAHLRPFPYVGKICFAAIWNGRRKWQAVLAVLLAALAAVLFGITLLYRTADPAQSLGSFLQQNSELYPRFELNFAYSETCDSPEEAAALLDESGAEYMLYNGSYFFGMTRETVEHFGFTAVTELLPLDDNCFYLDAEEGEKLFAESSYTGYWYDPTLLDDYMQPSYWETHALESFTVQDCVVIDGVEVPLESCGNPAPRTELSPADIATLSRGVIFLLRGMLVIHLMPVINTFLKDNGSEKTHAIFQKQSSSPQRSDVPLSRRYQL